MKRKIIKTIDLIICMLYSRLYSFFNGLDDKKVLFLSEAHESLDGNLKVMNDYINHEDFRVISHTKGDRRENESFGVKLSIIRDISTSKYIFLDDFYGIISSIKVRKGQKIIQLWHGAGAYKKFGFSRVNTGDNIKNVHSGYRKYTNVAVTAEAIRECYAEAFDVSMTCVKATGIPRTDMFFNDVKIEETKKDVYKKYPEFVGKKVVLIAPTYRGRKVEDANYSFEKLNLDGFVRDLGNEYVIAVKWHTALYNNIASGKCKFELPKGVIDCSSYSDVNDLLLVTDVLVTDYSSLIFDYYLTGKPIVYFAYDLEEYANGRGLYFDFDEYVFGEVATDYNSLKNAIQKNDLCENKRSSFNDKFMLACDGHATEKVYDWVFKEEID